MVTSSRDAAASFARPATSSGNAMAAPPAWWLGSVDLDFPH
jgi:hypothetical protein